MTLLAIRMLFSLPFFLFMVWLGSRDKARRRTAAAAVAQRLGLCVLLGFTTTRQLFDFWGPQFIISGPERLILFTNPTIVVVLSALFLRKHITGRVASALLVSLRRAGVGPLARSGHHQRHRRAGHRHGRWSFCRHFAGAIYMMVSVQPGASKLMRFTAYMMLVATGFGDGAVLFIMRPLSALDLPSTIYLYGVGLAIFSTAAPGG